MSASNFVARKGQVDYTNIRYCPVVNCVVKLKTKILLVQRSNDLNLYPGYWNGISGFLDDNQSINHKVYQELREEIGLRKTDIISMKRGNVLVQEAKTYKKTWIVFPILVEVSSDEIRLDWEAATYRWISPRDATKLKLLPGFSEVLSEFFS